MPQFPKPYSFGTHHSVMFSTKKLKKLGPTHWPTPFFFFFFPWHSSFSASPLHFSLPLHEPSDRNQGLDLQRRSPPSPSTTYLMGIITQRRKISSVVPRRHRFVIMDMADDKVHSVVFPNMPSWTWLTAIFLIPLSCHVEIPFAFSFFFF